MAISNFVCYLLLNYLCYFLLFCGWCFTDDEGISRSPVLTEDISTESTCPTESAGSQQNQSASRSPLKSSCSLNIWVDIVIGYLCFITL